MTSRSSGRWAGFPEQTISFLESLARHNDKKWFEAHREDYEAFYLAPAVSFVEAMAPRLRKIDASAQAVPKINGSIMRIHRDVRFSKDKSPYKDHMDVFFWCGKSKDWDSSGFFFRLSAKELLIGAGIYDFTPKTLAKYRKAVAGNAGVGLAKIAASLRDKGYEVGVESYKKVPRGFEQDHPRASLLKHSGLIAGWHGPHPKELATARFLELAGKHFAAVSPLHEWLKKNVLRS